jgi:hypothetical protein
MANTQYIIFNISEIKLIDFTQVNEDSTDTIRLSNDQTKSFVSWNTDSAPSFVSNLTTGEGPYTYDQIMNVLDTVDWNPPTDYSTPIKSRPTFN